MIRSRNTRSDAAVERTGVDMIALAPREIALQILPAGVVLVLQFGGLQGEARGTADESRFKHEGQGIRKILRLQLGG